jgi:CheY-like chemotaxis protein
MVATFPALPICSEGRDYTISPFQNPAFSATLAGNIPDLNPPKNAQDHMALANGSSETRRTVLVVDDFDDTRLLLRTWFERRGFRVIEAENGFEAINLAETESPDLIIMDVQMPQLDGSVPIVAVSAYGADQFRDLALAAGCNEYISTPFEPSTLEGIIRALVH